MHNSDLHENCMKKVISQKYKISQLPCLILYSTAELSFHTKEFFFVVVFCLFFLHHCALSTHCHWPTSKEQTHSHLDPVVSAAHTLKQAESTGLQDRAEQRQERGLALPQGCQIQSNRLPPSNSQRADRVAMSYWGSWLTTDRKNERENKLVFSKHANNSNENVQKAWIH